VPSPEAFNDDNRSDIALAGVPGWSTLPVAFSGGDGSFTVTNREVGDFAGWSATPGVVTMAGDFR